MNLFSRRTKGKKVSRCADKSKAHMILDRAAAGHNVHESWITWALRITGDLV